MPQVNTEINIAICLNILMLITSGIIIIADMKAVV